MRVPTPTTESQIRNSTHLSWVRICYEKISVPVNRFSYLVLVNSIRSEAPGSIQLRDSSKERLVGLKRGSDDSVA
jgi:hypothetical protein